MKKNFNFGVLKKICINKSYYLYILQSQIKEGPSPSPLNLLLFLTYDYLSISFRFDIYVVNNNSDYIYITEVWLS